MPTHPAHKSQRVNFTNSKGISLSGIMEWPVDAVPDYFAIFSHCFTCTKDLKAIVRISRELARHGIAVLRFDFTGLGNSHGNFSQTTFADNLCDIEAAVEFLRQNYSAPSLLIGHSLGGAAMLSSVEKIDEACAIVNIASPSNTQHLANFLVRSAPEIETDGVGNVEIGGRTYAIRHEMVQALRQVDLPARLQTLSKPLLIIFSPQDETLSFQHGLDMFRLAGGPVSFLHLDGADHLITNQPDDPAYIAAMIALWFKRYSPQTN